MSSQSDLVLEIPIIPTKLLKQEGDQVGNITGTIAGKEEKSHSRTDNTSDGDEEMPLPAIIPWSANPNYGCSTAWPSIDRLLPSDLQEPSLRRCERTISGRAIPPLSAIGQVALDRMSLDLVVKVYTEYVHPCFPILDVGDLAEKKADFKRRYLKYDRRLGRKAGVWANVAHLESLACTDREQFNAVIFFLIALSTVCGDRPSEMANLSPRKPPYPYQSAQIFVVNAQLRNVLFEGRTCPQHYSWDTDDSDTEDDAKCNNICAGENSRARCNQSISDFKSVPGMIFFAIGLKILNLHQTANSLAHIQAKVLASLYLGRLVWPFASYQYIWEASRAFPLLIASLIPQKLTDRVYNTLGHTLNACLQLESDLVRQAHFAPSCISPLEPDLRLKLEALGSEYEQRSKPSSPYRLFQGELRKVLHEFRGSVGRQDPRTHPQMKDINIFAGSAFQCFQRLSYRQLSSSKLNSESGSETCTLLMDSYADAQLQDAIFEINLPAVVYITSSKEQISEELEAGARACLQAASNSMKICHDENSQVARACIPGFCHSLFSKCLALVAVYQSQHKSSFGDLGHRDRLVQYVERLIHFFDSARISSDSLNLKFFILREIRDRILSEA